MHMQVLLYCAVFAAGQAVALYWRYRERQMAAVRLEAQLTSARLEALQSHVQPHFLFNSLHSIASLARAGDNAGVIRLTADLSELLRSSLDSNGRRHQTLREEMQLVEKYLAIQRVRFQDRLSHTVDLQPDIAAAIVPLFVAQPLVENALRHGVGPRVGPGRIHVRAFRDGGHTAIEVEDDGVGLPAGWSLERGTGTGLRNLAARLQAEFRPAHSLTIANRPAGGVIASVRLPPITS
jgi:two-component system LytT family sensor kinase